METARDSNEGTEVMRKQKLRQLQQEAEKSNRDGEEVRPWEQQWGDHIPEACKWQPCTIRATHSCLASSCRSHGTWNPLRSSGPAGEGVTSLSHTHTFVGSAVPLWKDATVTNSQGSWTWTRPWLDSPYIRHDSCSSHGPLGGIETLSASTFVFRRFSHICQTIKQKKYILSWRKDFLTLNFIRIHVNLYVAF